MVGNNGSLNFLNKIFSVVAATAMTVSGAYAGGLERDIALDPQHVALGENYLFGRDALQSTGGAAVPLLSTSSLFPGRLFIGSGVMISEQWGLSAWHVLGGWEGLGDVVHRIATGPNFISEQGDVRTVIETIPFPGSAFNNPDMPDLCLFRIDVPIQSIKTIQFGSAEVDDIVTSVGFGSYGSQATGSFPADGHVRGVRAPVASDISNFFNPAYYQQTIVSSLSSLPLQGRALSGDSGAGIFDAAGRLIGIAKATTNGLSYDGRTTYMKMTPEVQTWIASIVPAQCPADFNNDGFLDFFDYDDFTRCFEQGDCPSGRSGDFNGDGFTDFFDYGDFVLAFEAGC